MPIHLLSLLCLESQSDLSQSFQLVPVADYKAERDEAKTLIGGLKSLVLTEENKSLFNKVRPHALLISSAFLVLATLAD
jgi:hypothetical protein